MLRLIHVVVLAATTLLLACSSPKPEPPASTAAGSAAPGDQNALAPLYDNLGSHHMAITTRVDMAQKYFDQGVTLSYAFNHAEAIRAFRQAAALDADCAMCYWGVAFAYGPNINAPITEAAAKEAWTASPRERDYIEALGRRYTADPKAERAPLDRAYADAMRTLAKQYPDDLDAMTFFAQSLMDTSPWNYWDASGKPRAFATEVLSALESVLGRKADHVGAIHLYIHAVEASPEPARAEKYADRLPSLVPGAGHLQHMPAHIYLRTGRYADASAVNQAAIRADEAYFSSNPVAGNMTYEVGYKPHNAHFFVLTASMEGRQADALKAADQVKQQMHGDMLRDPDMGGMVQHMSLTPLYTKVRFQLWDDVLAEPEPPKDVPFMQAMWHAARALAYSGQHRLKEAHSERAALAKLKDDPALTKLMVSSVNPASAVAAIASDVVVAEIAAREGRAADAAKAYGDAVKREDALTYMEPPDWPIPVRQLQGATLMTLGRLQEAERAFNEDLKKFPNNGWSLSGLHASLLKQGRAAEAAGLETRLRDAWKQADIQVAAGTPQPARTPARTKQP
jgi:tetratricopeptide (TPR) repeat protein